MGIEIGFREIAEFGNTPGAWYAVAYFLSTVYFLHFNHNTRKGVKKWAPLSIIFVVLVVFMHLTTGCYGLYYLTVMLVVIALIYSIFYLCLEGDFYKKAYYTIRAFMLGEMMASTGWQIFYYLVKHRSFESTLIYQAIVMISNYLIILFIFQFLDKRHASRNRDLIITPRELITVFIGMFVLYSLSNLSYVVTGTPFTTRYYAELFIIRTIIDFSAVVILYITHELLIQTAEKIEADALKNILDMQYNQYKVQEESMALVNQKYHDLKHQIIALKAGASGQDSEKYLDQMLLDIKKYESSFSTGNKVLDAMLSAESMKCQARGIEFTAVADGSILGFMNPIDISALFGNALDNAIEGAEKVSNKEERLIHLSVDKQKSFVRIYVENRFVGKIKFRHNLPLTTKADTNFHGYGIKSMKSIAEKYGGSIQSQTEDGWFKLSILIPCG